MKELKFRAWDKKRKRWFRSYEEGLIWYGFHIIGECTMIETPKCEEFVNIEITQYTGLEDKNEKKIYANDIIRLRKNTRHFDKTIYPIIHLGYAFQMYDGAILNPVSIDYYDIIKIGNIYENPELLRRNK